jgi:hypothetical protein
VAALRTATHLLGLCPKQREFWISYKILKAKTVKALLRKAFTVLAPREGSQR